METATQTHPFDNGARAFDVICAQCGLGRTASVHDAPAPRIEAQESRTNACEVCKAPTSFERTDPAAQPEEGEVCPICNAWVCPNCITHNGCKSCEAPRIEVEAAPLCPFHKNRDDKGVLEVKYGNNCVACSLNERVELLDILAERAPDDGRADSVTFLSATLERYRLLEEVAKIVLSHGYRPSDMNQDDGDKIIEAKLRAALALVEKEGAKS